MGIRISSKQTLLQRNYYKTIVSEMKTRKNDGEFDLFIKYMNNVPIISKNDQPNKTNIRFNQY